MMTSSQSSIASKLCIEYMKFCMKLNEITVNTYCSKLTVQDNGEKSEAIT